MAAAKEAVKEVGRILHASSFRSKAEAFAGKYADAFDFGVDEGRPEHAQIHEEYRRSVEAWIEEGLGHGYDKALVEAGLPDVARSPGDETTALTLEILTAVTDFPTFRDMMLEKKAELQRTALLDAGSIGAMEEESRKIASEGALVWTSVVDDPAIRIDRAEDAGRAIVRTSVPLPLPVEQATDMFMDFGPGRPLFDEACTGCEVVKELAGPTDVIVRYDFRLPALLRYAMSIPSPFYMRAWVKQDCPAAGSASWYYTHWEWPEDRQATEGFKVSKWGVIRPGATPDESIVIAVSEASVSSMPRWLLGPMLKKLLVRRMLSMVVRYKQARGLAAPAPAPVGCFGR